jgi:hypothetical protein
MRRRYLILVLCLLTACQFRVILHDEDRAASDAGAVLELLYIRGDHQATHRRLHPDVQPQVTLGQLVQLASHVTAGPGPVMQLRLDSYQPMPGQRAMIIFFEGVNERGQTFHRITVLGDAGGYRVGGLFVQMAPYPLDKLRHRFSKSLLIGRQESS